MVQVTYRPVTEYIVTKCIKFSSPAALARRAMVESTPISAQHLNWIDGIVYRLVYPVSSIVSDLAVKEFMEGRVWVEVEYAEMLQFRPTINSEGESVIVPILDSSRDAEEIALVSWLKSLK